MEREASGQERSEEPSKHPPPVDKIHESRTDPVYVRAFKNRVRLRIGEQMARTADMSPDEARLVAHSLLEAAERAAAHRVR